MEKWQKSNATELVKFIKTTKTMQSDIECYNPQVKEMYEDGMIERRSR